MTKRTTISIVQAIIATTTLLYAADLNSQNDVTELFAPQYIIGNSCESDTLEKFKIDRSDLLGYIGPNFQRYSIYIDSVKQISTTRYSIYCRSKRFSKICDLTLEATEAVRKSKKYQFQPHGIDIHVTLDIHGIESNCNDSGEILGKAEWYLFKPENGILFFSSNFGVETCSDGLSNLLFKGQWKNVNSNSNRKLRFGWARIPDSQNLDCGAGEFIPCSDADKYGWKNYREYYQKCVSPSRATSDECSALKEQDAWWKKP